MGRLADFTKKLLKDRPLISRPDDGLPDYETRDRHLKSLRREHRRILDQKEKTQLKTIIQKHHQQQDRLTFLGTGLLKDDGGYYRKKKRRQATNMLGKDNQYFKK